MLHQKIPFLDEINPLPCICVEVDNKVLPAKDAPLVKPSLSLNCLSLLLSGISASGLLIFTVKSLEEPLSSKLLDVPTDSSLLLEEDEDLDWVRLKEVSGDWLRGPLEIDAAAATSPSESATVLSTGCAVLFCDAFFSRSAFCFRNSSS